MATFQVVYDDFSGGQYMGSRPSDQPKNTWTGNNVITNANGELIPTGTITAATFSGVASTSGTIRGHFYDTTQGYLFTLYGTSTRLHRYDHANGILFPASTTNTTLTGQIETNVTYSGLTTWYYYAATNSNVYGVSGATGLVVSTTAVGQRLSIIKAYKERLVGVSRTNPWRLLFTEPFNGTDFGAWTSTNYYELGSPIVAVFPRTDDLLIICQDGVYSLTGVLGSSVNIQMISPAENLSSGMAQGAVVNRSLFYVDNASVTGNIDGHLYRFIGISQQKYASFEFGDYPFSDTGKKPGLAGNVTPLTNGRLATQFRTGVTYFETTPGTFGRSVVWTINEGLAESISNVFSLAQPVYGAPDEYILTAFIDRTNTSSPITIYRTLINVAGPTKLDARFSESKTILDYKVDTGATTGNPGVGYILYGSSTQTASTRINISKTDSEGYGLPTTLSSLTSNNSFFIRDKANSNNYQKWKVTGAPTVLTDYVEVPVTLLESGGTGTTNFADELNITLTFIVVNPSGTVELSEYWHSKPFTVKEAFVEYSATLDGSVSCSMIPTGVVDVPAANLASVVSTAASETSPPAGGYRMYRYWPNNAAKGFGVKPQLTITNCFVKRVILNCED